MTSREQHSDTILLTALKNGNEEAFELLFNKYSGRLYYVAKQYLIDHDEILEIVQEVFFKVWVNHPKIKPELPFISYLSRIAKNLIINKSKRRLIENSYLESLNKNLFVQRDEASDQIQFKEVYELIRRIVDDFPQKRREVFNLSRNQGLSIKDISNKLRISESTVEKH